MKRIIVIAFFLFTGNAFAQDVFQGTIVYGIRSEKKKDEGELTVLFAPNRIKIKFREKQDYDKTYLLLAIDSGKFFTVNTEAKTYQAHWLKQTKEVLQGKQGKLIAGYSTIPVQSAGSDGLLGGLAAGDATLYVANDLFYPVPAKFFAAKELTMVKNNHIVLGMVMRMASQIYGDESDTTKQEMFSVEATKVEKAVLPATEFVLPADYEAQKPYDYSTMDSTTTDTTWTTDSVAMPSKQTPKKKSKRSKASSQNSKESAVRRKKQ